MYLNPKKQRKYLRMNRAGYKSTLRSFKGGNNRFSNQPAHQSHRPSSHQPFNGAFSSAKRPISNLQQKRLPAKWRPYLVLTGALMLITAVSWAQADGDAGISEATSLIKGYFSTGVNLMYAIGAVVGLIGAIKVYNKWSAGEPDTTKVAAAWFGACIFLVVVATVLKSFFSV